MVGLHGHAHMGPKMQLCLLCGLSFSIRQVKENKVAHKITQSNKNSETKLC